MALGPEGGANRAGDFRVGNRQTANQLGLIRFRCQLLPQLAVVVRRALVTAGRACGQSGRNVGRGHGLAIGPEGARHCIDFSI